MAGIWLLMLPVEFGFLLQAIGVNSPVVTGMLSAVNQGAILVGAVFFPVLTRFGFHWLMGGACLVSGAGILLGSESASVGALFGSGVLAGLRLRPMPD